MLAPTMDALLEIAKVSGITPQGHINFEKRREIYFTTQNFSKARLEESSVKVSSAEVRVSFSVLIMFFLLQESKESLQQIICMIREPLTKEQFGRVKAKAIVSAPTTTIALPHFLSFFIAEREQVRGRKLPDRPFPLQGHDCPD